MGIGAAGNDADAILLQLIREDLFILFDLFRILLEIIGEIFAESDSLCCDDMHERTALHAREYRFIDGFAILFLAHDDAAARSAKSLVGGGGHDICPRHRARIFTACDKAGEVCHIDHEECADFMGDRCNAFEVDDAGVCTGAADDELRLDFLRGLFHGFIVQKFIFFSDAVRNDIEIIAGNIDRAAVRQMTAIREVHAHHGVARF